MTRIAGFEKKQGTDPGFLNCHAQETNLTPFFRAYLDDK